MIIATTTALPIILFFAFLVVVGIVGDLIRFGKLPFKFSLEAMEHKRSFYDASEVVFKLAQWALFTAVVSVAAERTNSIYLSCLWILLTILFICSACNVIWSVIVSRIIFFDRKSTLSNAKWKMLIFCLLAYPILDIQSALIDTVDDFIRNLKSH